MPGRRVAPATPFIEFEQDDVLPGDLPLEQIQRLVDACESCHLQFWYPNENPAAESLSQWPK
jgi:hypothetical protein